MNKKKRLRRILIPVICVVLVLAIGAGCWFYFSGKGSEPVNVYSFMNLGMTEYWGDQQESYGPVTTQDIQTVFLSSTQTVTDILVGPGDAVQKGDLLMTFDTTLSDISLERKRLEVEKLKLDLQDAYTELSEIKAMKPMVIPEEPEEPEETDPGTPLSGAYQISTDPTYDGTSQELALICWLGKDTAISDTVLSAITAKVLEYREQTGAVPSEPTEEPTEEPAEPQTTQFYVVIKVTDGDTSLGQILTWQGLCVTYDPATDDYRFWFYDASGFTDHMLPSEEQPEPEPEIDFGSGYTAAQIAEMRSQQEKTIRDLQFQIKISEADYKIMQTEVSDGNVYAEIDGTVVSVLTEDEALMNQQPILKVSSGGGFYVEGSVGELTKDTLQIGQEVTVNDWNTGMTYTGTVESIADYPLPDDGNMYGSGNPNVSQYPFTVYVDGSADLQAGSYVSVMYSTASMESGIYLENPYLRTEQGKSYVYIRGADGLLEKRYVTTGKSLWGSYTEILDGITPEDFLAFPYGKHVKVGAETREADISELYAF